MITKFLNTTLMKKAVMLSLSVLFALTLTLKGQPGGGPPSPEEMAKRENELMKSELNMTADQLPKVEAINLKYAKKMGELFQQGPPSDFEEMRKKMGAIQQEKRTELAKVLNADQLKKYDAMMAERRQRGPGGPQ